MVQYFPAIQTPASMIGQALGQGLGVYQQRQQQQQQQNQLAKALFGDQANQFKGIPLAEQIKAADIFRKQKDQQELMNLLMSGFGEPKQSDDMQPSATTPLSQPTQIPNGRPPQQKKELEEPRFSDERIAAISLKNPVVGKLLQDQKAAQQKKQTAQTKEENRQFEADRDYHSKVSRPLIEAANETIKTQNLQKGIRNQLRSDISSGNVTGFFPFVVDRLGLESFRNPESARFSNEVKNLFVGSLNEIPGARPNQFIERFLSQAQPLIGRSVEANLSVMDLADFMEDVKLEQAKKELEIAKEDREKYGYAKEDIAERARERMGDYVNRRQEKMALDIQNRTEEKMEDADILDKIVGKTVIPGTYVTPRSMGLLYIKNGKDINKAIEEANSLGMRFPEYEQ